MKSTKNGTVNHTKRGFYRSNPVTKPAAAGQFVEDRLLQVILAPVISEKSTLVADQQEQVVFKVAADATKPEIKAAVQLLFKVQVESVQVTLVKAKEKRFGRSVGWRKGWKKAYVCLKPGQEIDLQAAP